MKNFGHIDFNTETFIKESKQEGEYLSGFNFRANIRDKQRIDKMMGAYNVRNDDSSIRIQEIDNYIILTVDLPKKKFYSANILANKWTTICESNPDEKERYGFSAMIDCVVDERKSSLKAYLNDPQKCLLNSSKDKEKNQLIMYFNKTDCKMLLPHLK